jgi:7-carboxy-7-deazaguanine synthase
MNLKINEIFYSIQGESTYMGIPCVFVRLVGCNLRCRYCDTQYAYEDGIMMSVDSVIDEIRNYDVKLVEITGGEPLLQDGVYTLMHNLVEKGYTVLLETNGSVTLDKVNGEVVKIVDVKCPSSGMSHKMEFSNMRYVNKKDQVKLVVSDKMDYDWAKDIIKRHNLLEITQVLMSPVHQILEPRTLVRWILDDKLQVRLQIQLHKYIWGPEVRGV